MARFMLSLYDSKCGAMLVGYRVNKAELGPVEYWIFKGQTDSVWEGVESVITPLSIFAKTM
jgi:hypothetical protein